MSYAVRNTIILLVTLFVIGGAAFAYIKFYQEATLEELEATRAEKQNDYNSKKATSDNFPELNDMYQRAVNIVENYDKALFSSNDPDDVFDYVNEISEGNSQVYFGFVFSDSASMGQYGVMTSNINGIGNYENFIRFINKLENSQLINKVNNLRLSQPPEGSELTDITFSFQLESYYQRMPLPKINQVVAGFTLDENVSTFNPFYPLIRQSLPPNENNLINVESSRLIGLSGNRVFIIDQRGNMNTLRKGDDVYLGTLESIDTDTKTATFRLNKGGIVELFTLEIAQ